MVLLVVDTQKAVTNEKLVQFELFEKSVEKLFQCARDNGVEVIYVRHDDGEGAYLNERGAWEAVFEYVKAWERFGVYLLKICRLPLHRSVSSYIIERHGHLCPCL